MLSKLKSVAVSILPIILVVLLVHFSMYRFDNATLFRFLIGSLVLVVGQVIFLTGLDSSIVPMGEYVGNSVRNQKQFFIFILFGFIFGLVTTIAEPDLQVFAGKISVAGFGIPKLVVLIGCGLGVGVMISAGLIRIVTGHSIKWILFIAYTIATMLAFFIGSSEFAMSLDSGACTTGVVTSPFLLAMGIGVGRMVSNHSNGGDENFGLIALSSAGPVVVMAFLSIIFKQGAVGGVVEASTPLWISIFKDVIFSFLPLLIAFFVYELIFVKISKQEKKRLAIGSVVTVIGFYLFLFGIEYGFADMGEALGKGLAVIDKTWITVLLCAFVGFSIVFCEPSIRILAKQIEKVTNQNVRASVVMIALAISVIVAVCLILLRLFVGFSIWWIYGIVFGLAFLLMPMVPNLFVSIAFDSSGVATGTFTVAFMFPIVTGLSGSGTDGFGALGIMVLTPTLIVELLGVVYRLNSEVETKKTRKLLLRLSKTEDIFSNMDKLKRSHEQTYGEDDN